MANPLAGTRIDDRFATRDPAQEARIAVGNRRDAQIADDIRNLLGETTTLSQATSVNLDLRKGPVHATTGIPYAIGGTATVISQKVGLWLAGFQDPIKAILGVGVHRDERVIIKRKYVVGSSATITPERAPARTVAIQEDVREVQLTRYGGDIEMNLNLFLRPGDAEEEMTMKVDAQKRELERTLVDLGYDMLMREGTMIVDAIMRSNPAWKMSDPNAANLDQARNHATKLYATQIFGALNKFRFPIANLLAAARYASAYSTGTAKGSVMILPHGIPDILRYARKESMVYNVTGTKTGKLSKPLTMELDETYVDEASSVRILVHHPTPTYEYGAANPVVEGQQSGLTDTTWVVSKHTVADVGDDRIADVVNGGFVTLNGLANGNTVYRFCKVVASSAILGAPGSGELLVGYPFTGVSTSHAEERMRIQLRCYLGAALYQPDNVLILPNVFVDGIVETFYVHLPNNGKTYEDFTKWIPSSMSINSIGGGAGVRAWDSKGDVITNGTADERNGRGPLKLQVWDKIFAEYSDRLGENDVNEQENNRRFAMFTAHQGAVFHEGKETFTNAGEFGTLDHPTRYMGLHGAPQSYEGGDFGRGTN